MMFLLLSINAKDRGSTNKKRYHSFIILAPSYDIMSALENKIVITETRRPCTLKYEGVHIATVY